MLVTLPAVLLVISRAQGLVFLTGTAPYISALPTSLTLARAAAHPNVLSVLDVFHFWAGASFEDLDLIRNGEIAHIHFEAFLRHLANCSMTQPESSQVRGSHP